MCQEYLSSSIWRVQLSPKIIKYNYKFSTWHYANIGANSAYSLTSLHTPINTHKMPSLDCRSTLLKRADIFWHVSHYHWDTATDVGGADSIPGIEDGSGTYQVWYVSALIAVRIHPKWSWNMQTASLKWESIWNIFGEVIRKCFWCLPHSPQKYNT